LATGRVRASVVAMARRSHVASLGRTSAPAPRRDSADPLYDDACELLDAAQAPRAAAAARGAAPAIAATLGCLEAALDAVGTAVESMELAVPAASADRGTDDGEVRRIRASFTQLARDLSASRASCAATQQIVGPMLSWR
jgi:hypothetical protein